MNPVTKQEKPPLKLKCPSCGFGLGNLPEPEAKEMVCPKCSYKITWDGACWDACVDPAYPRSFARQWVLWENGKLGNPNLVYGNEPKKYFREMLAATSLTEEDLKTKTILEVGFGHGRLLHQTQQYCPSSYGIDLSRPLKSARLRPGSAFFGNVLNMPFEPSQFDVVICRGILHHTPEPRKSFACAAQQLKPNGVFYLGGHYEPRMKLSFLLRRTCPWSWKYPEFVSLPLSGSLSVIRSVMEAVRTNNYSAAEFQRSYGHFKLEMFDILAPRWASEHPPEEVKEWFTSQGMLVRRLGAGEYVGVKAPQPAEESPFAPSGVAGSDPMQRSA